MIVRNMIYGVLGFSLSVAATAAELSSELFLNFMLKQAPSTLCSNQSIISCMAIDKQACIDEITQVNPVCASRLATVFPNSFAETNQNMQYYTGQYTLCLLDEWSANFVGRQSKIAQCFNR